MNVFKFISVIWITLFFADVSAEVKNFDIEICSVTFEYKGEIYFCGDHHRFGKELFRSNGSPQGTTVVADIDIGPGGSNPKDFFILSDKLYFIAETASTGREIWRTDGTKVGTKRISNAYAGPEGFPRVNEILQGDNLAYLETSDGLWRTDGTQAGTEIILPPSSYTLIASMNEVLYFSNKHSYEKEDEAKIYKFEERSSQSELVKNFGSGCTYNNYIGYPGRDGQIVRDNKFYFGIYCDSFTDRFTIASDGSESGTKRVINGGTTFLGDIEGYRYFFNSVEGKIQYTDGSTTTTLGLCERIAECGSAESGLNYSSTVNGKFIFGLTDENFRRTIWTSDGSVEGSEIISYGNLSRHISNGSHLVFTDSFASGSIFSTDGTRAGTTRLKEFAEGWIKDSLYTIGNKFIFFQRVLTPSSGHALWVSSGTPSSTKKLADFKGLFFNFTTDKDYVGATVEGNRLYFSNEFKLWHTDGTIDGTYKVTYLDDISMNETPEIETSNVFPAILMLLDDDESISVHEEDE